MEEKTKDILRFGVFSCLFGYGITSFYRSGFVPYLLLCIPFLFLGWKIYNNWFMLRKKLKTFEKNYPKKKRKL